MFAAEYNLKKRKKYKKQDNQEIITPIKKAL